MRYDKTFKRVVKFLRRLMIYIYIKKKSINVIILAVNVSFILFNALLVSLKKVTDYHQGNLHYCV